MSVKTAKLKGNYNLYTAKRQSAGLSNADVARITGMSEAMMSYWKSGKRTPKLDSLSKIAEAVGCEVSELISYGDEDKPIEAVKIPRPEVILVEDSSNSMTYDVKEAQMRRLLTYYRLMTDRDKGLLLDMAKRMAEPPEEGDHHEEP